MSSTPGDHSPFYRRKFEEANLTPDKVRSLEDISRLPFIAKEDLRKDQEAFPPWGSMLTLRAEECQRIHMTSGTTGRPIKILDTPEDWSRFCHIYGLKLYAYGIRKTDMVMPAFSFGPWIGFWAGFYACQEIGCLLFASGGMKTEQRVDALVTIDYGDRLHPFPMPFTWPMWPKKTGSTFPARPAFAYPGIPERPGRPSPACGRRSKRAMGAKLSTFSGPRRSAPGDLMNFNPAGPR